MSDTKIDMARVTKWLQAGVEMTLFQNGLGSFSAVAENIPASDVERLGQLTCPLDIPTFWVEDDDQVWTDDFTPEQALTRLAYKLDGEIL